MDRPFVIVDGYNFLKSIAFSPHEDMERAREDLTARLSEYSQIKGHRLVVVFDGKGSSSFRRQVLKRGNVEVWFSKAGEEADQVIREMAWRKKERAFVVTSDRALSASVRAWRVVSLSCEEFERKLREARRFPVSKMDALLLEKGEIEMEHPPGKGKGRAYRLPKKEKKRLSKLRKL